MVECLLCGNMNSDLVQHGKHVAEKHTYAEVAVTKKSKLDSQIVTEDAKIKRRADEW